MAVYAAGFDPTSTRPRVGILIAGIGMSEADSLAAIKDLPAGVTLAISPYASNIGHLLDVARMTEHEYLLSIPMEPQGYPVNDPDDRHALMTSLPPAENLDRLRWVLSRLTGYVGVTNALGQMHGERLAGVPESVRARCWRRWRIAVCCSSMPGPASRRCAQPGAGRWIWRSMTIRWMRRRWTSGWMR